MNLATICDLIILVYGAAIVIINVYNKIINAKKSVKNKITENQREFVIDVINEVLPDMLLKHDLETRKKYLADRMKYLEDIKQEVITTIKDKLEATATHEERMEVFSEVLKELLRERIMTIYNRNKDRRKLEEHEKVELEHAYSCYKAINGNSYIDGYYARMKEWEVIPDNYQ